MSSGLESEILALFLAVDCQTKLNVHTEFSKLCKLLSIVIVWNAGQIANLTTLK